MLVLIRAVHGLISAFFLGCLAYVRYCAMTDTRSLSLALAIGALLAEGVIVAANGGDCPLGILHRKAGDEKTFFELFLPKRAAAAAVPVLGSVTGVGFLLLLV